jgi:membrane protein required for colicin V production
MTVFDWLVPGVIALSALLAFARGIVRSLIALATWVAGFIAALAWSPYVGSMLPQVRDYPFVPHVIAFVLIFLAAMVVGALIAWPLRAVIHRAGLGFVDRSLGALFGVARGVVLVMAFVLAAGVTTLPDADWWQNSWLARPLSELALALRPWLPPQWADRLDYSGRRAASAPDAPAKARARACSHNVGTCVA